MPLLVGELDGPAEGCGDPVPPGAGSRASLGQGSPDFTHWLKRAISASGSLPSGGI